MNIRWKKLFFNINEIYGKVEDSVELQKTDVHVFFQQPGIIEAAKWNTLHKETRTLFIELHKTEEQLRTELNKSTRYQINKAERDGLTIRVITNPNAIDLEDFKLFFNAYAKEKGIELFQEERINGIAGNGKLFITYVYHKNGDKLAGHLYIADGKRAGMFYSGSVRLTNTEVPKNDVGRANRYLHWHDILFFKKENYQLYDFYGISLDENNKDQQNINQFKRSFGGKEVTEYRSFIPQTLKGNLFVFLLKIKWRNQVELIKGKMVQTNR
ncbi:aminoacyltransferase [Bacillus sp. sid0103]|uniref:peptidoglycan bridge formation glycyltransferase FemA/FemB family protein n=1 Tax=Bacillus sp. sid0103 TaxID=2856337 RepID=UPI001C45D696|nr:peptidoglycan bridge formation glycyltransferase FemA/FemB family protein [Bacillus sp. sid0103]MBV7505571.1 aminoacyltransferase [Bacillus sp. sid0103]